MAGLEPAVDARAGLLATWSCGVSVTSGKIIGLELRSLFLAFCPSRLEPLLDGRMLNAVLIMVLVTAILGPVLTQRFAPHMLETASDGPANGHISA